MNDGRTGHTVLRLTEPRSADVAIMAVPSSFLVASIPVTFVRHVTLPSTSKCASLQASLAAMVPDRGSRPSVENIPRRIRGVGFRVHASADPGHAGSRPLPSVSRAISHRAAPGRVPSSRGTGSVGWPRLLPTRVEPPPPCQDDRRATRRRHSKRPSCTGSAPRSGPVHGRGSRQLRLRAAGAGRRYERDPGAASGFPHAGSRWRCRAAAHLGAGAPSLAGPRRDCLDLQPGPNGPRESLLYGTTAKVPFVSGASRMPNRLAPSAALAQAGSPPAGSDVYCSSTCANSASRKRIITEAVTTAAVVDRPTPSAPCLVLKPM